VQVSTPPASLLVMGSMLLPTSRHCDPAYLLVGSLVRSFVRYAACCDFWKSASPIFTKFGREVQHLRLKNVTVNFSEVKVNIHYIIIIIKRKLLKWRNVRGLPGHLANREVKRVVQQ